MRQTVPWGLVATISLLGIALAISVSHGRLWDSIAIAVLIVPGVGLVFALTILRARAHR